MVESFVTGLLAWRGGQPGQVGNEAATAVFHQCRGSGSSPSFFLSVVGRKLASAVGLKFVSGLRVSDPYGVQFPSALLALLWRCLCAVVRVPAMRCLFVVRRFATLASHYFFLSVRLPFSMRRSCMPVRGRIAFARYRY